MGAQLAFPNRQVIAVVGDGGFQMTLNDLATVAQLTNQLATALDLELAATMQYRQDSTKDSALSLVQEYRKATDVNAKRLRDALTGKPAGSWSTTPGTGWCRSRTMKAPALRSSSTMGWGGKSPRHPTAGQPMNCTTRPPGKCLRSGRRAT